jgi:hypothetical protein
MRKTSWLKANRKKSKTSQQLMYHKIWRMKLTLRLDAQADEFEVLGLDDEISEDQMAQVRQQEDEQEEVDILDVDTLTKEEQ